MTAPGRHHELWSLTHARLHTLLRQRCLLPRHSRILLAVSGGQDSLCLARLLIDMQPKWQWSLAIVHCDHRWRTDSAANATHVMRLADRWQIPAQVEVATVPPLSEAAARTWRYETLAAVARAQSYSYVVTGHTASDRAETALYNLLRGTGLEGIGALPWQRSLDSLSPRIGLVRPLLAFSRQETAQFCQQQQLSVWQDSSNDDLSFRRNRIRHELLPYLREHFNPQVERTLAQTAEVIAADVAYLEAQATELYAQVVVEAIAADGRREWAMSCGILRTTPLSLQRRVARQVLQQALPHPPHFQQVEKLVRLMKAPNGSRTDTFPGGYTAQVRGLTVWLGSLEEML
ncbi:MAG: tRNA lysidine(34) synthetase TilS [Phormidesmis sp.]